jgi:hypothetical protein
MRAMVRALKPHDEPLAVDCAFPGGNIIVEGTEGDEVRVHQDLRDTAGDWFYWCMRVRGAGGRPVRFTFTRSRAIGVRGPAQSLDGGATWRWLGRECVDGNAFTCAFPADAQEVRLSFGMPYQLSRWAQFAGARTGSPHFSPAELCRTRKGRPVPYARAGCLQAQPRHRAVLTCRHHCCEMMAAYALEGLVDAVLIGEDEEAEWLRRNVEFLVVPFVDLDGVEDGDQGKNRRPHDHNRDYAGEAIYPSVRAIRWLLPAWGAGRLHLAADLHCPWIDGLHNEVIYLVGSPEPALEAEQRAFSKVVETLPERALSFSAADFLPFGVDWNSAGNESGGKGFGRWAGELPGIRLAFSMEIPYANAGGCEVNQATTRAFGRDLARAICRYLSQPQ